MLRVLRSKFKSHLWTRSFRSPACYSLDDTSACRANFLVPDSRSNRRPECSVPRSSSGMRCTAVSKIAPELRRATRMFILTHGAVQDRPAAGLERSCLVVLLSARATSGLPPLNLAPTTITPFHHLTGACPGLKPCAGLPTDRPPPVRHANREAASNDFRVLCFQGRPFRQRCRAAAPLVLGHA